ATPPPRRPPPPTRRSPDEHAHLDPPARTRSLADPLRESVTMLRRNLRQAVRYPSLIISIIVMPVVLLLVFAFVFGGALEAATEGEYIDYLAPGMLLMIPAYLMASLAVQIATDTTKGIVNR